VRRVRSWVRNTKQGLSAPKIREDAASGSVAAEHGTSPKVSSQFIFCLVSDATAIFCAELKAALKRVQKINIIKYIIYGSYTSLSQQWDLFVMALTGRTLLSAWKDHPRPLKRLANFLQFWSQAVTF